MSLHLLCALIWLQNHPLGVPFYTVYAKDPDEGFNAMTEYSIVNSIPVANNFNFTVFDINKTTGEMFLNFSLNINTTDQFYFDVSLICHMHCAVVAYCIKLISLYTKQI